MKRTRNLSLPLVVLIAVAALVIGSFGTADASGLTTKAVRKIAGKVVLKKAPGLSVKHADTATKADSATKATTATTANDANTLAGQPSQLYLDRMGYVSAGHISVPGDSSNTLATVTVTMPQGAAIIHAIGNATFTTTLTHPAGLWLRVDAADCPTTGTDYGRRTIVNLTGDSSAMTQFATPVPAGTHTVRLCASVDANGFFAEGISLAVTTVPRGSSGGGSL